MKSKLVSPLIGSLLLIVCGAPTASAELCEGLSPFELGDGSAENTFYLVQDQPTSGFRPVIYEETNGIYTSGAHSTENLQRGGTGSLTGNRDYCAPFEETRPPDQLIH